MSFSFGELTNPTRRPKKTIFQDALEEKEEQEPEDWREQRDAVFQRVIQVESDHSQLSARPLENLVSLNLDG